MHADESTDYLQVTQLFGPNIQEEITSCQIIDAIPPLDGVLHSGGQLAVGSAKLLKKHVAKLHVWLSNIDGVHQLFYMMVHRVTPIFNLLAAYLRSDANPSYVEGPDSGSHQVSL